MEDTKLAVILLAGVGSRMKDHSQDTHKALTLVGGKPILWYSLSALEKIGISRLVLVVGSKKEQIQSYVEHFFSQFETTYIENTQYKKTNSLHSFSLANPYIQGQGFFRQDGDLIYTPALLTRLKEAGNTISVAYLPKRKGQPLAEYRLALQPKTQKIERFGKDLSVDESDGIAMGIEFISQRAAAEMASELNLLKTSEYFHEYPEYAYTSYKVKKASPIAVDCSDELWFEIDTPEDLKQAEKLSSSILKK